MRHAVSAGLLACALIGSGVIGPACAHRATSTASATSEREDAELDRIRSAVARALRAQPPRGYAAIPKGVRLLSIARGDARSVVMDFSAELLTGGTGRVLEDALHQIVTAASSVRAAARSHDYRILINGVPLDTLVP